MALDGYTPDRRPGMTDGSITRAPALPSGRRVCHGTGDLDELRGLLAGVGFDVDRMTDVAVGYAVLEVGKARLRETGRMNKGGDHAG